MDLVILDNFLFYFPFPKLAFFNWLLFTGSKFTININSNLAILLMTQTQNYNFWSRRPQILQFFLPECRRMKIPYAPYSPCEK